jgi:hypothetical protein
VATDTRVDAVQLAEIVAASHERLTGGHGPGEMDLQTKKGRSAAAKHLGMRSDAFSMLLDGLTSLAMDQLKDIPLPETLGLILVAGLDLGEAIGEKVRENAAGDGEAA